MLYDERQQGEGQDRLSSRPDEDYSTRILQPLLSYIALEKGDAAMARVASRVQLSPAELRDPRRWISLDQLEAILGTVHEIAGSEPEFRRACSYREAESYGLVGFLLRAASIRTMYALLSRTLHVVCRVGRYELVESTPTRVKLRYTSSRREGRLVCISRQAQLIVFPTVWGVSEASLTERSCVARGDPSCEYDIRWAARPSWTWPLLGALIGVGIAAVLHGLQGTPPWHLAIVPPAGLAFGWLLGRLRTSRIQREAADEINRAMTEMAREASEAQREVLALSERQNEWTRQLESQIDERTAMVRQVLEQAKKVREVQFHNLRGFSHDLKNPLAVLCCSLDYLEDLASVKTDGEACEVLGEMRKTTEQIQRLLDLMMTSALIENLPAIVPESIVVADYVDVIRRRLKALVHGRDLRASVFSTREAPTAVRIDPLLLDRVVDNLLSNAAKYTMAGSIIVEVGGSPGMLCLKISDTGPGISSERIEEIFLPGQSQVRAPGSYGVGLSGVVRLLGRIDGRLEVLSQPGVGSTFWTYIPVEVVSRAAATSTEESLDMLIHRVVTIRRSLN
jgi:signal transduction histidine kinase